MKLSIIPLLLVALAGCGSSESTSPKHHAGHPSARLSLHRLWTQRVSPNADSAPAYAANVRVPGRGTHSLVYVLAANNGSNCNPEDPVRRARIYALDAGTGKVMWSRATSGPSRCTTAGPVVDPSHAWVYAPGLDGKAHKYNAATGREAGGGGWPVVITLMPGVEKVSATPTIGNGRLYVTTSGFIGDQGHYQGHLVSIDLKTGHATVFNSLCSSVHRLLGPRRGTANYCSYERSGLFGRGQGVVDPVSHAVFVVTGNGVWNGRTNWGDSVMKLAPSGSRLLDAYTPTNQADLDAGDLDLGSTGPALLPTVRQSGHAYHFLVQGGKGPACSSCGGVALRLLNRDNLSGRGGPGHLGGDLQDIQAPGGGEVLTAPAVWYWHGQIWVFYASGSGTAGYRLFATGKGKFRLRRMWSNGNGGSTPIVGGSVLYVASGGTIRAYNPGTGQLLARVGGIGGIHWEYPRVAGGRLFVPDESGHVTAFSIRR